jgi:hypothetical protein
MRVTFPGTGCPQVDRRRFGPASPVCAEARRFLISIDVPSRTIGFEALLPALGSA